MVPASPNRCHIGHHMLVTFLGELAHEFEIIGCRRIVIQRHHDLPCIAPGKAVWSAAASAGSITADFEAGGADAFPWLAQRSLLRRRRT